MSVSKSSISTASTLTVCLSLASALAAVLPHAPAMLGPYASAMQQDAPRAPGTMPTQIAIAVTALDLRKLDLSDFGDSDVSSR